ncbi:hypothetical protein MNBD_GAMMA03-1019 [hydrothermal vent metagenome]|uniref:Uncharacterized protein n=1 Tax=hydrothermal vent metagenome TaxID=652676 RepID=A0A3B0WD82_9ZZZZ
MSLKLPSLLTLTTQSERQDQGALHFDDILLKTANVNVSGQSSQARHIQIRGIGQRDEYTVIAPPFLILLHK